MSFLHRIKRCSLSQLTKASIAVSLVVPASVSAEDLGEMLGGAILQGIAEGLSEAADPSSAAPDANSPAYGLPKAPSGWQPGMRVECNWQGGGTFYQGTIRSISGNNLYIHYDDGDEEQTQTNLCRSPYSKPNTAQKRPISPAPPSNYYAVGSYVLGHWNDGYWYPARVQSINQNSYALAFDGGKIYSIYPNQVAPFNWQVGSGVQCNWQGAGTYYNASIAAMSGNRMVVRYSNGNQEDTVTGRCRSGSTNAKNAKSHNANKAQMLRDSARDVPSDPADFLRAIERNSGR